jgi:FkbM family methyltransferase
VGIASRILKIRRWQGRIRYLWRVMPLIDAMRLTLDENKPGEARISLWPIEKEVVIRRMTTDLKCLEKVFIANEYKSPFEMAPQVIVDAGANIGMATLFFAHAYPNARIFAIEPEPLNFEMLKKNCREMSNVTLLKAALWHDNKNVRIANPGADAWAFTVTDQTSQAGNMGAVSTITITDILGRMNVDQIDLLKLDVEGAELQLFSNGADKWLGRVRNIVVELHDRYLPGCAQGFYSALMSRRFVQELNGENIFIKMIDNGP